MKHKIFNIFYKILVQVVFIFLSSTVIFSLYYIIANSLKTTKEFNASQFSIPKGFNFENFRYIWTEGGISVTFKNSMLLCVISVVFVLIIGVLAGFAFTFIKFKGKKTLSYLIISTMYISPMALIIPLFIQFTRLNLVNSYFGIIMIYVAFHLAYSIYLITTYFKNIPTETLEAATIDGCSKFGLLMHIFLPLSKSGIIVLCVINFSLIWNDVLFGFIFLQKPEMQTVMVQIAKFQGKYGVGNMTHIMAALLIISIPTILLYLLAQRFFRDGILAGSIK